MELAINAFVGFGDFVRALEDQRLRRMELRIVGEPRGLAPGR